MPEESMTIQPHNRREIPEQTQLIARQVFPKGNVYLQLRDEFGELYEDAQFVDLFCATSGQRGYSPGQLALVIVLQFMENLTDRQAAESVRSRIDWKYLLGLDLTDTGFDYSILSEFRHRLVSGGETEKLLNTVLQHCQRKGWLKSGGKQRTDSTHVLAAVRQLNRLEVVGETLRHTLEVLATTAPEWLLEQVEPSWLDRYGSRVEQSKLAKSKAEQTKLVMTIGKDGHHLLQAIENSKTHPWLAQIPAVRALRWVWIQQYFYEDELLKWREASDLPPFSQVIQSPYDLEVRNRTKRQTNWTGYAVHLSETCDEQSTNLITHVVTTPATVSDSQLLPEIHQALDQKDLKPAIHLVDSGYIHSPHLDAATQDGIDMVAPVQPESQTSHLAISCFAINWEKQQATCPQGKTSSSWIPAHHSRGHDIIRVNFSLADCRDCPISSDCLPQKNRDGLPPGDCLPQKKRARTLHIYPQGPFEALEKARERQKTPAFWLEYRLRSGIEGTLSQAVRAFELRRTRYIGLAKTHLQQVAIATGMNLLRLAAALQRRPKGQTRLSHFSRLMATQASA
jgi:transposase